LRRHTLAAGLAALCLAAVPAAALGAEPGPLADPGPLAPAQAPPATSIAPDDRPEAPPAPPGEESPEPPRPPDGARPEAPPAPPGELSP
jgi:cytochrome c